MALIMMSSRSVIPRAPLKLLHVDWWIAPRVVASARPGVHVICNDDGFSFFLRNFFSFHTTRSTTPSPVHYSITIYTRLLSGHFSFFTYPPWVSNRVRSLPQPRTSCTLHSPRHASIPPIEPAHLDQKSPEKQWRVADIPAVSRELRRSRPPGGGFALGDRERCARSEYRLRILCFFELNADASSQAMLRRVPTSSRYDNTSETPKGSMASRGALRGHLRTLLTPIRRDARSAIP